MNDPLDQLESELRGLVPRHPAREIRRSVAVRLRPRHRGLWPILTGAALAASVMVALALSWIWQGPEAGSSVVDIEPPHGDKPVVSPNPPLSVSVGPSLPTVWAFRRAAIGSSDELDSLLARRDAEQLPVDPLPNTPRSRYPNSLL